MDVLLRYLREGPDGVPEYQDTDFRADTLSIGSAADCAIQLLGEAIAAEHALIRGSGGKITISCRSGRSVLINSVSTNAAELKVDDRIDVGGHQLRMLAPPAGFEIAIEIRLNPDVDPSAFERAFRTDLHDTWLSKRKASWLLALLIVAGALLVPLAMISWHRAGGATPIGLPDDTWWNAGPLSPAHQLAAGQRCDSCHKTLFVHVRDRDCRSCHKTIVDHVSGERLAQTSLGSAQRCAECHREHNENAARLVIRDNSLCTGCHARSETRFGPIKVTAVTGFSRAEHPAFTVDLLKSVAGSARINNAGVTEVQWRSYRENIARAREQSNLKFSHAQHLDFNRVQRLSDRAGLGCSDCHTLSADGEHFVPITMQRSCVACHELTFDPTAPKRQLPHGKPRDAMLLIQDYFARQAIDPHPPASVVADTVQRRRLPDQQVEEVVQCTAATFSCAMQRAQADINNQFTRRGCVSCHVVVDNQASDVLDRYQVTPIRLTYDYFPDVHFSHRSHAVQKGKTADEACLSCHAARTADSSEAVLIPDLPKCLECHSGRPQRDLVRLQCISCHAYHPKPIIASNREARRE